MKTANELKTEKKELKPGMRVTVNGGYRGIVKRQYCEGMWEVDLGRTGGVCVDINDIEVAGE
jgi:preprotein translocase subunit YajC